MHENQIIRYMMSKRYIENKYVCWDFVIDVMRDLFGIELPEYPVTEVQTEFKNRLRANLKNTIIKEGQQEEGDIIVFSLFANQHAGVIINKDYFIHLTPKGVVVTGLNELRKNYVIYRIER